MKLSEVKQIIDQAIAEHGGDLELVYPNHFLICTTEAPDQFYVGYVHQNCLLTQPQDVSDKKVFVIE